MQRVNFEMSFELLLSLYLCLLGSQQIVIPATIPSFATKIVRRASIAQWVGTQAPEAVNIS